MTTSEEREEALQESKPSEPEEEPNSCPGCDRILDWPYESGRWRKIGAGIGTLVSKYQHEHQDQWVDCPGKPESSGEVE